MSHSHVLKLSSKDNCIYRVARSTRAKYIRININQKGDVYLVIPKGIADRKAHQFLQSKRAWVEKNLKNIQPSAALSPIRSLDLKFLNEYWTINYKKSDDKFTLQELKDYSLIVTGPDEHISDIEMVSALLKNWLKEKARESLPEYVENIASSYGFSFNQLTIRAHKTRWGSCSSKKNLNLNCKLLFMPKNIVRYVIIHELCHTLEMNHSPNFWQLVSNCDPQYKNHRKQLNELGKLVRI